VLRCLRPRNQLKGGISPGDSPWRVLTPPPHLCRPLTPACLQSQREEVISRERSSLHSAILSRFFAPARAAPSPGFATLLCGKA